jgi:glyoxylase-like metal-dependent hydrolase (beta-lactamase superfamily II)
MKVFKKSEFVISELTVNRVNLDFRGVKDNENISDGVKVVYTPGHTEDHASLFIETNRFQYSEMMGSGGMITGLADFIIPGHGGILKTCRDKKS